MDSNTIIIPNVRRGMLVKITPRNDISSEMSRFGYITGEEFSTETPGFKVYILDKMDMEELSGIAQDTRLFNASGEFISIKENIFEESNIREFTQFVANSMKENIDRHIEIINKSKVIVCEKRRELKAFPSRMKEIHKKIQNKFI